MRTADNKLIELETRFWQSMVDQDTDAALAVLHEPAVMVSPHGTLQFDHDGYRKMAEQGSMIVTGFKLSDVQVVQPNDDTAILTYRVKQNLLKRGEAGAGAEEEMVDSSTWIRAGGRWQCVMHTETPLHAAA